MTEIKSDREKMREDGYQAGLRGLELEECPLWGAAWGPVKGTNAPAYLIAGWIAGNAMWLHAKKLSDEEGTSPPVDPAPKHVAEYNQLLFENFEMSVELQRFREELEKAKQRFQNMVSRYPDSPAAIWANDIRHFLQHSPPPKTP
jgi:ribosome modulation factor